jgi:hypothetical protein
MGNDYKTFLMQIGKWASLAIGTMGSFLVFSAWFLVPGDINLNRLVVAGLFASLATNSFLISGILFCGNDEDGLRTVRMIFRTPPVIASGLLIIAFILVSATTQLWARH